METKKKAKQLIQKYLVAYKDTVIGEFYFNRAKECALICVEENVVALQPWKNSYMGREQIKQYQKLHQAIKDSSL